MKVRSKRRSTKMYFMKLAGRPGSKSKTRSQTDAQRGREREKAIKREREKEGRRGIERSTDSQIKVVKDERSKHYNLTETGKSTICNHKLSIKFKSAESIKSDPCFSK